MANKITTTELSPAAKARAVKAIEAMHLAYYEAEEGVRALYEKLESQISRTSRHILQLAQYAYKQAEGDFDEAIALYLALCRHAEESYKEIHGVPNVYETLPVWRVFKSNILRGLRHKIDPLEHSSEHTYRRATTDLITRPAAGFSSTQVEQLQELVNTVTIPRELRPHLVRVLALAEFLKENRVHEAEAVLAEAVERLMQLADRRKPAVRKLLE